jgi:hypothetical protein
MDIEFFKSLDKMLKKHIEEGEKLGVNDPKNSKLQEIAKYACQILAYRKVLYRVQLSTETELIRSLYFTGIEGILADIYKDFLTLPMDQKVRIYTKQVPKFENLSQENSALKSVIEKKNMLQTNWLTHYGC